MFNKIALILGIWAIGYTAWAGNIGVAQAQGRSLMPIFSPDNFASSSHDRPTPSPTATATVVPRRTPRPTLSPSPTDSPTPSPSPTDSPQVSPSATPTPSPTDTPNPKKDLAASIASFFKGNSGTPPSGNRGLNILASNPEASPYAPASQPRFWYVLTGALAFLGMSTIAYGRSKHS